MHYLLPDTKSIASVQFCGTQHVQLFYHFRIKETLLTTGMGVNLEIT